MIISIIAAMSENRVIGLKGAIPWDIPDDRRRFRELTMGHSIIMGRKTFEQIGRPLPGRRNILLTRQQEYRPEGCIVAHSLEEALAQCEGSEEVFVCGGEQTYRLALPLADKVYLTVVHRFCAGDAFFPPLPAEFAEKERTDVGFEAHCTFILYERRTSYGEAGQR